jgi:hypothetical protein
MKSRRSLALLALLVAVFGETSSVDAQGTAPLAPNLQAIHRQPVLMETVQGRVRPSYIRELKPFAHRETSPDTARQVVISTHRAVAVGVGIGAVAGLVAGVVADHRTYTCGTEHCGAGPNFPVTPLTLLLGAAAGGIAGWSVAMISRIP